MFQHQQRDWKTALGSPHVLSMQWLPPCSELGFTGKVPLNEADLKPWQAVQLQAELSNILLPLQNTTRARQGKGWLWLGITGVICFILFLSQLGSCHCLAGTQSCFYIPRNLCKKIDLSFHSRFCNIASTLQTSVFTAMLRNSLYWDI